MPAQIPRHYGLTGRPRWWSPKPVIWSYPVASLAVGVAMFVIIRADAGKAADHGSIQNMSFLAAYLSLVILATTVRTIAIAQKRAEGLGWWFAPMTLAGMLLLVFIAQH